MFTGIIEEVGSVRRVRPLGGGMRLTIEASFSPELHVDQSVSVNGACQTVVAVHADAFEVVAIEETLRKTSFGQLRERARVNLERAMMPGDRLDGHFVQGHVDATGTVAEVKEEATERLYRIQFPARFATYAIPVGSIALDGISLTIARLEDDALTVAIIPHTIERTAIDANWKPGAAVNLEFDMIGKYVVGWMERRGDGQPKPGPSRIREDWLRAQGY